jgi:hypothetical protein
LIYKRAYIHLNNYFEKYQTQSKILGDVATCHRELAKPCLYMLNNTHIFFIAEYSLSSKLRKLGPVIDSKGKTIKRILHTAKC